LMSPLNLRCQFRLQVRFMLLKLRFLEPRLMPPLKLQVKFVWKHYKNQHGLKKFYISKVAVSVSTFPQHLFVKSKCIPLLLTL
jgi:hypothetical protein